MKQLEFKHITNIYIKLLKNRLNIDLQYRTDFFINISQLIFFIGSVFILIEVIYLNTQSIYGWTKEDMYLLYGLTQLSASIYSMLFNGISSIAYLIQDGNLDKLLLKPYSVILNMLASDAGFFAIGEVIVSLGVIIYAFFLGAYISPILILISVISSQLFIFSFNLFLQSLNFYSLFPQTANDISHQLIRFSSIPIPFYSKFWQLLFIYIFPLFITGGLAIIIEKQEVSNWIFISAIANILFLFAVSLTFFKNSLKHYTSVSS